jgi:hypothetical protein
VDLNQVSSRPSPLYQVPPRCCARRSDDTDAPFLGLAERETAVLWQQPAGARVRLGRPNLAVPRKRHGPNRKRPRREKCGHSIRVLGASESHVQFLSPGVDGRLPSIGFENL